MKGRAIVIPLMVGMLLLAGCLGGSGTPSSSETPTSNPTSSALQTTSSQETRPETWNMSPVWHVNTSDMPVMDLAPDGSLAAVIDWWGHKLYLARPDGSSVSFDLMEPGDIVEPVVAGVTIVDGKAYVLGSYGEFTGVRIYSWSGKVGETHEGGAGAVADDILRSPSGNHMCYLVSTTPTEQILVCDGEERKLVSDPNANYGIISLSDTGVLVMTQADKSVITKNGQRVLILNTTHVLAYGDKLIASYGDTLKVLSLDGKVLASRENAGFGQIILRRWTLIPTKRYIFRHEPLEDTHVFTWNLTEIRILPGFPYFANDNFVVTAKDGVIHCYSLDDFHEVFHVKVPGDSLGFIKLSEDGKVMLVSDEYGGYWLYHAKMSSLNRMKTN